jgi:chromate transporter
VGALQLFLLVSWLTALSFGGGQMLLAGLERELVRTQVVSPADYATAVALGQSTPGPLAAFTTAMGMAAGGLPGAVAATLAMVGVSLGAVWLITRVPPAWFLHPAVRSGLVSVRIYAAALAPFVAYRVALVGDFSQWAAPAAIVAGVAAGRLLRVPTPLLMVGAVLAGMLLQGTGLAGW